MEKNQIICAKDGGSFMLRGIAQNSLSKCFLSGEKIEKGEEIITVISGGSKYSPRNYRNIKLNFFKKEILNFL